VFEVRGKQRPRVERRRFVGSYVAEPSAAIRRVSGEIRALLVVSNRWTLSCSMSCSPVVSSCI
jgi:hypothetical protein